MNKYLFFLKFANPCGILIIYRELKRNFFKSLLSSGIELN